MNLQFYNVAFCSVQVLLMLLTLTLETESASIWYTGENRPYDFGYTIEGNQHRRESKGTLIILFLS